MGDSDLRQTDLLATAVHCFIPLGQVNLYVVIFEDIKVHVQVFFCGNFVSDKHGGMGATCTVGRFIMLATLLMSADRARAFLS